MLLKIMVKIMEMKIRIKEYWVSRSMKNIEVGLTNIDVMHHIIFIVLFMLIGHMVMGTVLHGLLVYIWFLLCDVIIMFFIPKTQSKVERFNDICSFTLFEKD